MSLPTPVPPRLQSDLLTTLRDIVRRAVDGTVVPLFVKAGQVLIGSTVSSGPNILQVTGDAKITGLLTTGNQSTGSLSASGSVWAGSLTTNGTLQAGSAVISGRVLASNGVDSLTDLTGSVNVAGAAAPSSGQVLTATGANSANWQTPSSTSTDTLARLIGITSAEGF